MYNGYIHIYFEAETRVPVWVLTFHYSIFFEIFHRNFVEHFIFIKKYKNREQNLFES